jgi:hypothetical protein
MLYDTNNARIAWSIKPINMVWLTTIRLIVSATQKKILFDKTRVDYGVMEIWNEFELEANIQTHAKV